MSSLSSSSDGAGGVLNRWYAPNRDVNITYVNKQSRAMYVSMAGIFISNSNLHTSGYEVTVENPTGGYSETFRYYATSSSTLQTVYAYGSFLVPKGGSYTFVRVDSTFVFADVIEYY